jgi:DNA-binding NarL/FixJ family response regulator
MMKIMTRAMIFVGKSAFQEVLKNIFHSRFPSVELLAVADGIGAMEKIESVLPDLILIDIKLPGNNALELIRKIETAHPEIIVILLASYDLPEYREAANRHGADYFMVKDSPVGDYIALIESILSARGLSMKNASWTEVY